MDIEKEPESTNNFVPEFSNFMALEAFLGLKPLSLSHIDREFIGMIMTNNLAYEKIMELAVSQLTMEKSYAIIMASYKYNMDIDKHFLMLKVIKNFLINLQSNSNKLRNVRSPALLGLTLAVFDIANDIDGRYQDYPLFIHTESIFRLIVTLITFKGQFGVFSVDRNKFDTIFQDKLAKSIKDYFRKSHTIRGNHNERLFLAQKIASEIVILGILNKDIWQVGRFILEQMSFAIITQMDGLSLSYMLVNLPNDKLNNMS